MKKQVDGKASMHDLPPVLGKWIHGVQPDTISKQGVRASLSRTWMNRCSARRYDKAEQTALLKSLNDLNGRSKQ
jgi:hypothetical protein